MNGRLGPAPPRGAFRHPMPRYLELIKARLAALVLLTTAVGFVMAGGSRLDGVRFFLTLLGTALSAAGANAFNQWAEIRPDGRMERTRQRPLPTGRLSPGRALLVAYGCTILGVIELALLVNFLTAGLALLVILLYTLVYTPLKQRTPLCTLVGAVCGAIPPMMGWAGATDSLDLGAWILGAILFLWQIPHFLALAWLYRDDYARGGFRMLPAFDPSGSFTGTLAVIYVLALWPLGLVGLISGLTGWLFLVTSLLCGVGLFVLALRLLREKTTLRARQLFLGTLVYLPLILGLMVADRGPAVGITSASAAGTPVTGAPVATVPAAATPSSAVPATPASSPP
jgi:protoheme IX farnesyltransferase